MSLETSLDLEVAVFLSPMGSGLGVGTPRGSDSEVEHQEGSGWGLCLPQSF